ncbi:hypothetical protein BH23ACT4_BH23ACT4_11730 [soil metagenome]
MSGRLTVGVIGQTMRGAYCRAHFAAPGTAPAVILTDDPGAFSDWEPVPGVEILPIADNSVALQQKVRRRLRREVVEWLRSGSVVGAQAEKLIRRVRPAPRVGVNFGVGADAPLRQGLITQLHTLHEASAIGQIVVFDVFDLPSVLKFSDLTGVPVVIR